jgi:ribosomal protein S27AE
VKTACPSCGAEVEFRFDDSFVRICSYCRAAVQRTDRGVDSLGKVADLVPLASPLRLFADGQLGTQSFILVGMAQLRHGAGGLTQEWYARFSDSWGWLAEAQGRYFMTFEAQGVPVPPRGSLAPGQKLQLPTMLGVLKPFTVAEVGRSTYLAANGELPFRLVPNGSYDFVDLSDGEGNFATIDYGGHSETPTLYVGQQVSLADLRITGGEVGPPRDTSVSSQRLACPSCNAPIELFAAEQAQRAACGYCSHLLDIQGGSLQILGKLAHKPVSRIPLGTRGTFSEGEMTVIGFVQRSAGIEGLWYPFEEYLLHEPTLGFRWLVLSDGHWSYVQPIAVGAVEDAAGANVRYDGVKFRMYQRANLRVDTVLGEFYWKVQENEMVEAVDYVAPPAMISRELGQGEENWSLSTYMTVADVEKAFGGKVSNLGTPIGVAPNQPDPVHGVATPLTLAFIALIALGIMFSAITKPAEVYSQSLVIPPGTPVLPEPTANNPDPVPSNVFFSEPFQLVGGKNVELGFNASVDSNWAYIVAALVNTDNGDVVSVDANIEYYSGVDDGESWSEGSRIAREVIGPVAPGPYVLRLEMQQGGTQEVAISVRVRQGVFRGKYLGWALLVLGIPFLLFGIYTYSFERRRWANSSDGPSGAPKTALTILVVAIVVILSGVVVILKAIAESSSDD